MRRLNSQKSKLMKLQYTIVLQLQNVSCTVMSVHNDTNIQTYPHKPHRSLLHNLKTLFMRLVQPQDSTSTQEEGKVDSFWVGRFQ